MNISGMKSIYLEIWADVCIGIYRYIKTLWNISKCFYIYDNVCKYLNRCFNTYVSWFTWQCVSVQPEVQVAASTVSCSDWRRRHGGPYRALRVYDWRSPGWPGPLPPVVAPYPALYDWRWPLPPTWISHSRRPVSCSDWWRPVTAHSTTDSTCGLSLCIFWAGPAVGLTGNG